VDFMSIGSNDLTQYTLAVDRTNSKIAHLFNDLHPAVLLLMRKTIEAGIRFGKKVSICGELAGNPEAIAILLGLGFTNFSLSPSMIPVIKKVIRSVSVRECTEFTQELWKAASAEEIRKRNREFLEKRLPVYQGLI
jgi:phosphotransferase system enzyme I (PtsI)